MVKRILSSIVSQSFYGRSKYKFWELLVASLILSFSILSATLLFTIINPTEALSATIYLPDNYSTIQAAVNAANPGDTIIVRDGTYTENVKVDKNNLTIRSEDGAEATIVQAANSEDHVFEVTADYVEINEFTARDAMATNKAGIYLNKANHCNISNNIISNNNYYGVLLEYSDNNILANNTANMNIGLGISLSYSNNNSLISNTANFNKYSGIDLYYSHTNSLVENTANSNKTGWAGISLAYSSENTLTGNITLSNNGSGIRLDSFCSYNTITGNTTNSNDDHGILLITYFGYLRGYNILTNNTADSNGYSGITISYYGDNTLTNNVVSNNPRGIRLSSSSDNKIYLNNFINNSVNVYSEDLTNTWHSPEKITYVYNKATYTNYLGNYWSDYTGSDADGDGIGDTSYNIDSDKDDYPLMKPFENYPPTPTEDNPPTVEIISLSDGETVSGTVRFSAHASDDYGVEKFELYIDDELKRTDNYSPAVSGTTLNWDCDTTPGSIHYIPNGSHTFKAKAYDTAGQTSVDTISFIVNNIGTITIQGKATLERATNHSGIAIEVWLYEGGNPVAVGNTTTTTNGSYSINSVPPLPSDSNSYYGVGASKDGYAWDWRTSSSQVPPGNTVVIPDMILHTQKWVSFNWVYQPDGTTNLSSSSLLSSGSAVLYSRVTGPGGDSFCSFIFSTNTVVGEGQGDDITFYDEKLFPYTFFMPWADSGGIHDMGAVSLESIIQAPDVSNGVGPGKFYDKDTDVIVGHTYCIVTKDGVHYAKIYVTNMGSAEALLPTGSISGTIFYVGAQENGTIYVSARERPDFYGCLPVAETSIDNPGSYSITGLPEGTYYILVSTAKSDILGVYGPPHDPTPITVKAGENTPNIDITLRDIGWISGTLYYTGTQTGSFWIGISPDPSFSRLVRRIETSADLTGGTYHVSFPSVLAWYVCAFRDSNGNGKYDSAEPFGMYGAPDPVTAEPGADTPNIDITLVDPSAELTLLEKYAPVLYLHDDEEYWPWGIYSMLNKADLWEENKKKVMDSPTPTKLKSKDYNDKKYYLNLTEFSPYPDIPTYNEWDDYTPLVYGRKYESSNYIVLQYWFFYPFDDWTINNHEGDWEMAQVVLDKAEKPKKLCLAWHHDGNWCFWGDAQEIEETHHAKIFITLGGHGCWANNGENGNHKLGLENALLSDETSENGKVLYPQSIDPSLIKGKKDKDKILYALEPINTETIWVDWLGKWGEKYKGLPDWIGWNGPDSPVNISYHKKWPKRWEDPICWCDKLKEGETPSLPHYIGYAQSTTPVLGVSLHAYDDEYGLHVGYTETGEIEATIEGTYIYTPSTYSADGKEWMWIDTSRNLRFEIKAQSSASQSSHAKGGSRETSTFSFTTYQAQSEGKFNFVFNKYLAEENQETTVTYQDVPFAENTVATVDVSPENPGFIMEIDLDGDGVVDETKEPDIIEGVPTTGSISGTISYTGAQTGDIYISAFDQFPFTGPPVADTSISTPGPYSITDLPESTYYVLAQVLISGGDAPPFGVFGPPHGPPNPVNVIAGEDTPNIDITLRDPGSISGTLSYAGTQTGTIYLGASLDPSLTAIAWLIIPELGPYSVDFPSALTWYIFAFIDSNGNGEHDNTEAFGKHGAPDPVTVEPGVDTPNIDITLVDPTAPPTGTIVINAGAKYTRSKNVTLTLDAENAVEMCFSNDNPTWSAWEAYTTTKSWALSSGDGQKTVYVKFKDASGVESDTYSDTIILDTTAPTGSISINKGAAYTNSRSVSLTLSAIGAATMCFSNDNSSWSIWENHATSKSWTLVSGDGTKRVYVRFMDNAGNVSETYSDTIILDTTPPNVAITSPKANTYVGGTLDIIGTATDTHFRGYKLYYGQGESPSSWNLIKESDSSVDNSTLGSWDTTKVTDGTYTLKLWADDRANNSAETKVKIFIDNTPPEIENLGLDQENFIPGDYASSTPTILATLTDTGSGVDETTIDLRIKPAEGDEIVVPASSVSFNSETGEMSYTVTESLADSEYIVSINVKDKVGNSAEEKTTEFVIESELTIEKVLNYPNPFSSGTKFTYHLTRDVDEVTIKVYTVAGELVKTIDFASSHVGYNEEEWDGINDYGEELANGTYVYKITVKFGDEKVSKVQMLTVLK